MDTATSSLYRLVRPGFANGAYGHEALGSLKLAAAVSTKASSYMMEVAHAAQKNAAELDKARRAVEKYVIGTDVDTISDADPFVAGTDIGGSSGRSFGMTSGTPQENALFEEPIESLSETQAGQQMFGKSAVLAHQTPYLMLGPGDAGGGGGGGAARAFPATPADMDGRFLQSFDNYLARNSGGAGGADGADGAGGADPLKMFL